MEAAAAVVAAVNVNLRYCETVDGPKVYGAFCETCGCEALPMSNGSCGFCDTRIVGTLTERGVRRNSWSDPQMLDALRVYTAKHGKPPTRKDCLNANGLPARNTLAASFGSFAGALETAGIERPKRGYPKRVMHAAGLDG